MNYVRFVPLVIFPPGRTRKAQWHRPSESSWQAAQWLVGGFTHAPKGRQQQRHAGTEGGGSAVRGRQHFHLFPRVSRILEQIDVQKADKKLCASMSRAIMRAPKGLRISWVADGGRIQPWIRKSAVRAKWLFECCTAICAHSLRGESRRHPKDASRGGNVENQIRVNWCRLSRGVCSTGIGPACCCWEM